MKVNKDDEWIEIDSMFSENMGNGIEIDTGI